MFLTLSDSIDRSTGTVFRGTDSQFADYKNGYDLDLQTPGQQAPRRFRDICQYSISFNGTESPAGNLRHASTAHEAYLVDFTDVFNPGAEHLNVRLTWENLIDEEKQSLAPNLLDGHSQTPRVISF